MPTDQLNQNQQQEIMFGYSTKVQLRKGGASMVAPQESNDLVTKSYLDSSLVSYLPKGSKAVDSSLLNGQPGSYYSDIISRLGFIPENTQNKGQVLGYAELDINGLIPVNRLPKDVFNVKQYSAKTYFPDSGSSNVIYIDATTNFIYRWNGYNYVGVTSPNSTSEDTLKLKYARNINGTPFDGTSDIVTNYWGRAVNLTIGNTTKQINGSVDLSWSIEDILGYIPVNKAGDTIDGPLLIDCAISNPLQAVNKGYVDNVLTNAINVPVGGMILYDDKAQVPEGFLRCNGSLVNIEQYRNLYEVIGNKYSLAENLGGGSYWSHQYAINTNTDNLGSINYPNYTIDTKNSDNVVVGFMDNTVYVGYGTTLVSGIIDSSGNVPSGFTVVATIPSNISTSGYILATNTSIYIYGCYSDSGNYDAIYSATINTDKTIGSFSQIGTLTLPDNFIDIKTDRCLYLIGENNTSIVTTLDNSLNPTTFEPIPGITVNPSLAHASACCNSNYAYIVGAVKDSTNKVYIASINNGVLGSWVDYPIPFDVKYKTSCTIVNGYIYVNNYVSIYRGTINNDGSISDWTIVTCSPISYSIDVNKAIPTKQFMYSYNNSLILVSQNYYYTTINGDMTIPSFRGYPYILNNYNSYSSVYFVTKNKIYSVMKYTSNNTVVCSDIDSSGNAGGFYVTNLHGLGSYFLSGAKALVYNNTVYIIGGNSPTIYASSINSDGSINNFYIVGSVPGSIKNGKSIIIGNALYYIGGIDSNGNYVNNVYYSFINSDGSLGSWLTTDSLPTALVPGSIVFTGKYLYTIGGNNTSYVYRTSVNADNTINTWVSHYHTPISIYNCCTLTTTQKVHMLYGGVYYTCNINMDGSLGSWSRVSNLNIAGIYTFVSVSSKVYMFGGLLRGNNYCGRSYHFNYSGGLNDYSYYYNPLYYNAQQTDVFRLPLAFNSLGSYIIRY